MQIICPNCSTTYRIAATAIGESGRSVRCTRCQNVWRVDPEMATAEAVTAEVAAFNAELSSPTNESPAVADQPPAELEPAATIDEAAAEPLSGEPAPPAAADAMSPADELPASEPPAQQAPVALSDIPIPMEESPPLQPAAGEGALYAAGPPDIENGPADIESVAARRARAAARRRFRLRIPLPLLIFTMFAAVAAMFGLRKDVVRHVPQLASFYASVGMPVNLRGLEFANLKIGNEIHDGVPVLVVEGTIVSKASMPVDVPRLRFALRNAAGAEVYAWTAIPPQAVLKPEESMPFRSRLASPPAEGQDVQVRFFNRRDAVAGGR